jgi:amino acid adenylation domain-containing protein
MTSAHTHQAGRDTVHGLFERQTAATPEAAAVCHGRTVRTYAELDEAACRLAVRLRERGARRGDHVGVLLDRSVELVVALLAVLKSGAAWIGLEPTCSARRLGVVLDDAGVALVVTRTDLVGRLPAGVRPVVLVDEPANAGPPDAEPPDAEPPDAEPADDIPPSFARPEDLAFVVYTSASTGRPGVMVEHRCATAFLTAIAGRVRFGPGTWTLLFAGIAFDAIVGEVFGPLTSGGAVVVPSRDAELMGAGLVRLLEQQHVTTAFLPPSVLALLPDAELPDLRTLVVGGEVASPDVVERWERGRNLHLARGCTEATWIVVLSAGQPPDRPLSTGHPLPDVEAHVLDDDLWPVARGTVGELYLGGPTVSRGYLGRPALTAELFGPHPFARRPGTRLYRTGDLARVLPDGGFEFVGRTDDHGRPRARVGP